ncbi:MAG: hypothetical protein E6I46_02245 [Chloroflexi bacterium]|nr:MAG: hypothetical protein E6I46_02245 [Chloroflexota bacterium]
MVFVHPHVNFELSTAYTVAMHAGYADASGQQNTLDHSWHFTTEGRPMLTSVDPGDNAGSVAPDRNIILSFNRAMRADTMRAAVQLSPDTPFLLRTRPGGDGAQFEIIPLSVLQSNQAYTVSIDRPMDVHDNALDGQVQTHFRTGNLSLLRKIGYLVGQREQPAFAVGLVDPHADSFLSRATTDGGWHSSVRPAVPAAARSRSSTCPPGPSPAPASAARRSTGPPTERSSISKMGACAVSARPRSPMSPSPIRPTGWSPARWRSALMAGRLPTARRIAWAKTISGS